MPTIQAGRLNVAVALLMKLSNEIDRHFAKAGALGAEEAAEAMEKLAIMLHPMAPLASMEILSVLDGGAPVHGLSPAEGQSRTLRWPVASTA